MKNLVFAKKVVSAALLGVLVACGGGSDDEAGAPVELNATPAEFGYKGEKGDTTCFAGNAGNKVFINGGAAPYRVENPWPAFVTVSTTKVESRGGHFEVYFTGACTQEDGVNILVLDALNNQIEVTIVNLPGDEAT